MPAGRFLLLVSVLFIGPVASGTAQSPAPFGTVTVQVSGATNVHRNFLHEFWRPGRGGGVSVATPFYLGEAELSVALHRYLRQARTVPSFDAVLLQLGWNLPLRLSSRLRWTNGLGTGIYRMAFDEDDLPGVRNESELAVTLRTRLDVHVAGPWSLHVGGHYTKAFTFHRLKLWYATAGISRRFTTPEWLRAFLR